MNLDILLPVRNGGSSFSATLRSLASLEGHESFRILISDNHSIDGNPWEPALGELRNCRVERVRPPTELGRVEHWNWIAGQAYGDAVKFVMAGDVLQSASVLKALEALDRNPEATFVFGPWEVRYPDKIERSPPKARIGAFDKPAAFRLCLDILNPFGGLSGITFRRAGLIHALPFDSRFPWTADIRLCLRCLEHGLCLGMPDLQYTQERRIPRFSSSFRAIGRALKEEWALYSEVQAVIGGSHEGRIGGRIRNVLMPAAAKLGRATVPTRPRKWLGALVRKLDGAGT